MESIQYKALYRIAGAFKMTSRAALEVCLHVPPPIITLTRTAEESEESCLRIHSSPFKRTLNQIRASWPPYHNKFVTGGLAAAPSIVSKRYTRLWSAPDGDPPTRALTTTGCLGGPPDGSGPPANLHRRERPGRREILEPLFTQNSAPG
jgi:hypothetical protein